VGGILHPELSALFKVTSLWEGFYIPNCRCCSRLLRGRDFTSRIVDVVQGCFFVGGILHPELSVSFKVASLWEGFYIPNCRYCSRLLFRGRDFISRIVDVVQGCFFVGGILHPELSVLFKVASLWEGFYIPNFSLSGLRLGGLFLAVNVQVTTLSRRQNVLMA